MLVATFGPLCAGLLIIGEVFRACFKVLEDDIRLTKLDSEGRPIRKGCHYRKTY